MDKHLVLVGGGHAHMTVLVKADEYIKRGHRMTLISPAPYHYYSGMGPGMLAGIYKQQEIWFHVKKMVTDRGAAFVEAAVARIDPRRRILFLSTGDEIPYDVASFNTGSHVPVQSVMGQAENVFTVKPIENLLKARRAILDLIQAGKPNLVVVGGGAAGLEISGSIWRLVHDEGGSACITLLAGRKLLARFSEKVRRLAMDSLSSRGIDVREGSAVSRFENHQAVMSDGRTFPYDLLLAAWGIQPSPLFRDSGMPTGEDGGLLVNDYLQSIAHPEVFGGGDCISFKGRPLDKVGVYAVRQNPILYHNLMAALEGREMVPFRPQEVYLLIFNLGNNGGIFWRSGWTWNGRLAFYLKDYIDRRFMRTFQVSGEQEKQ